MHVFSPSFAVSSLPTSATRPPSARVNSTQRSGQKTRRALDRLDTEFYTSWIGKLNDAIIAYYSQKLPENIETAAQKLRRLFSEFVKKERIHINNSMDKERLSFVRSDIAREALSLESPILEILKKHPTNVSYSTWKG
ncbi:MAG: hypothetical protein HEQ32_06760 [Vampirovibrio sp.]